MPELTPAFTCEGRKVGIYVVPGFNYDEIAGASAIFQAAGMMVKYVSNATGPVTSSGGKSVTAEFTFENSRSTYYDAVIFVGGADDSYVKSLKVGRVIHAAREAFMHKKAIGATGNAIPWLTTSALAGDVSFQGGLTMDNGVVMADNVGTGAEFAEKFMGVLSKHRFWAREVDHIAA